MAVVALVLAACYVLFYIAVYSLAAAALLLKLMADKMAPLLEVVLRALGRATVVGLDAAGRAAGTAAREGWSAADRSLKQWQEGRRQEAERRRVARAFAMEQGTEVTPALIPAGRGTELAGEGPGADKVSAFALGGRDDGVFLQRYYNAPSSTDFQGALDGVFAAAAARGQSSVEVSSGGLHRRVGGYPGRDHRMPSCCSVMRRNLQHGRDEIAAQPPSGQGASLTILYQLPR